MSTPGNRWTGSNRGGWSNAEYDRLVTEFNAEPTPVITPHPMSDATSNGMSGSILIAACEATTVSSAKVPVPA